MIDYDNFQEINAPSETLDTLIFSKGYPKELGIKLNPKNNPVMDFFELNDSTILRINATVDFHECYYYSSYPGVLTSTQCQSVYDSIVTADAQWVEEVENSKAVGE